MAQSRTTEALIKNAVEAFQATGLTVGAVEVMPGGRVRVLALDAIAALPSPEGKNTCDDIFGESD